jgi:hypothetical protein
VFNVSACQSKTKVEKANGNITSQMVVEPLTKPILLNQQLDIRNPVSIKTEKQLREHLIEQYHLPEKWEKHIKNVKVCADKTSQVIAISLENDNKADSNIIKQRKEHVVYLKESQENSLPYKRVNGIWKKKGSYMTISTSPLDKINALRKSKKHSDNLEENKTTEMVTSAIVQQLKVDRLTSKKVQKQPLRKSENKELVKLVDEHADKLFVNTNLKAEEITNHIKDALMNSKEDAVVILHRENRFPAPREIHFYIPEFKSRGFRFYKWTIERK